MLFFIFGAALLFIAWQLAQPLLIERGRERRRRRPFPPAWSRILRAYVPYFRRLPADLQIQLKQHMQVFIAEKAFVGCNGLVVTDAMRVCIAASACLLILNRRTDYYPGLRQILLYPGAFIVNKSSTDEAGVLHRERQVLAGESWTEGQVILSWQDILEDSAAIDDGYNVVIHEFAHQLDQQSGYANGAPQLAEHAGYERWSRIFNEEFERLRERTRSGQPSLLDEYAATDPAEFFAVVSEIFFEQPRALAAQHPALYEELSRFYCVDPLSW